MMSSLKWEFFFGACFLTGALLLPHVSPRPVFGGMALAALIRVAWFQLMKTRSIGRRGGANDGDDTTRS